MHLISEVSGGFTTSIVVVGVGVVSFIVVVGVVSFIVVVVTGIILSVAFISEVGVGVDADKSVGISGYSMQFFSSSVI